jgi:hypothetical protein
MVQALEIRVRESVLGESNPIANWVSVQTPQLTHLRHTERFIWRDSMSK